MLLFLIYFAKPVILCEWCLSKTSKAYMFTHEFGSADALVGLQYLFCINFYIYLFLILSLCRNKFVEFDMKPVCKKCYEKFPLELKKRLKKLAESK